MTRESGARRVLFISFTSERKGPTNSLLLLLGGLRNRYDVSVLMAGHGPLADELEERGIRYWNMERLDRWSIPAIARLIRAEEIDLVYGNTTHRSSRNAFVAAALTRRPFVCHVREMLWHRGWFEMGYLRWAAAVIAVSCASARAVQRFVREKRLHVVHNGVPEPPAAVEDWGTREDVRGPLGVPEDACLILSVSSVTARKGQLHAIRGFAHVAGSCPRVHLCLAGDVARDPGYAEAVSRLATAEGLEDRVHFLGHRRDVRALMNASEVFLHTALKDPHPRAVLEAMSAGLPVVAFAVDGVAETVLQGETGLLVRPADDEGLGAALEALVRSPDTRRRMGNAGRHRVAAEFTARATSDGVDRVLRSVLDGTPGTSR